MEEYYRKKAREYEELYRRTDLGRKEELERISRALRKKLRGRDVLADFYTKVIGMKTVGKGTMPHGGKYVHLRGKGSKQTLELNWYPQGSRFFSEYRQGEELDHLAFVVKDVKKAYKELLGKGAEPAVTPRESKGTEVYVKDPDGIWIELLSSS